eukprot:TRINITY_DN2129_c0_g4_i2.p1 TRINITY_DN2129_c0_g4~~TRINITY_DN2129_c0_g4_i2.p1  ORF type:complete len:195 (-),score=40.32 TRINITY_DN2129_c0_g4_i2:595-1179(-)
MEIFDLVDLRVNFSAELLHSFYEECVVPSFGMFKDELESEADWRDRLLEDEQKARFLLHIVLAVHKETRVAMGGLVFEYYKQSNCGLYTYAAASPNYRGKGFAKFFIDKVLEIVNTDAQKYHGRNCDVSTDEQIMQQRHKRRHFISNSETLRILSSRGFWCSVSVLILIDNYVHLIIPHLRGRFRISLISLVLD